MRKSTIPAPSDEEILAFDNVPADIASRYIGTSTPTIYAGLRQGRIFCGWAVKNEETDTWTYNISPGGLVKYKREGNPIIRLGDLREILTDFVKDYIDARMAGLTKILESVLSA